MVEYIHMLIIINAFYPSIHPSIHSFFSFDLFTHSFLKGGHRFLGTLRIQKLITPNTSLEDVTVFRERK